MTCHGDKWSHEVIYISFSLQVTLDHVVSTIHFALFFLKKFKKISTDSSAVSPTTQ